MLVRKVKNTIRRILLNALDLKQESKPAGYYYVKNSYSQSGEDLIMSFILGELKIEQPTYLDIGAHHAWHLSNTALFYINGNRGVLIEPDPQLFNQLKKERPQDICLNVGIGTGQEEHADFYIMGSRTLNTFSKEEAERYIGSEKQKIEKIIQIPLVNINTIIDQYIKKVPDIISLDTEGYDLTILQSLDFSAFRPKIFCIETLTYTAGNNEEKIKPVIDFMLANDYLIYADTYINTIFVDTNSWKNRA
jgi:FkbM family methyltransferase